MTSKRRLAPFRSPPSPATAGCWRRSRKGARPLSSLKKIGRIHSDRPRSPSNFSLLSPKHQLNLFCVPCASMRPIHVSLLSALRSRHRLRASQIHLTYFDRFNHLDSFGSTPTHPSARPLSHPFTHSPIHPFTLSPASPLRSRHIRSLLL